MIREGGNLEELEKEVRNEQDKVKQVCVWGIQKFFDHKQCYKFFKKNFNRDDLITHICKYKSKNFFVVKLSEQILCSQFNKNNAKNKRVKVRPCQKQQIENQDDFISLEQIMKRQQNDDKPPLKEDIEIIKNTNIQDIVEPYHQYPYKEQVELKVKDINKIIENYNTNFFKDPEVKILMKDHKQISPIKMDQFFQCLSQTQGYRTKSQFTIGENQNGEPVVGFNKGNYSKKTIMIQTPKNVKIISKHTKLIVALTQSFIKQRAKILPVFNRLSQQGFWRYLVVRESERTKQTLIMIVCKTKGVDNELLLKTKEQIKQFYKKTVIGLKSLCLLSYDGDGDSIPSVSPQVIYGVGYYEQRILDHTYRVSPTAFLQIHIQMCEVLYKKIIEAVKDCDVVLDLGCGIGTIGISVQKCLPDVKVIGIQICPEAVEDAKQNSPNYEVWLGRAQDHIKTICDQHRGRRIVAILDPPRAGFNKQVMIALRRCRGLDNLIYVACNAGAIEDNILQLTLPVTQKRKAPQFVVKHVYGFDLFPQTKHFEVLYVLERK